MSVKVRGKAFAQIRSVEDEDGGFIIRGAASNGDLDRKGTFIDQKSLKRVAKSAGSKTVFWNHDWNAPVGRTRKFEFTDDEFWVESFVGNDFEIPIQVGLGGLLWPVKNIRALIEQGIVNEYSIGFDGKKHQGEDDEFPTIEVTDLMEISIVSLAANKNTKFSLQRSMILDNEDPRGIYIPEVEPRMPAAKVAPVRFEFDEKNDESQAEIRAALDLLKSQIADW